ncbi:MAG TPA: surface-adhesin E family protein [Candidatus Wunengus sp. YC60]|uniref:surface-adhesin E family protein n=1 Tax=Candidatus Wunengus sp. YC60 TaxID=3367697 RepID=UPI004026D66F
MKISIKYFTLLSLLFAIILFSSNIKAKEEKWKQYATGKDHTKHYYDLESVVYISSNIVRVWEKTTTSEASASLTRELNTFREMDCSKLKYRVLEMRVKYLDGSEKEQSFTNPKWVDITHDTWMHTLYEILYKQKQQ